MFFPSEEIYLLILLQDPLKIHYENNSPFLTITSMTRLIEVSHWGNIAVEETVDLKHTGANLKGPFSRYDYQRQPDSGISSVKSFKVRNGGHLVNCNHLFVKGKVTFHLVTF